MSRIGKRPIPVPAGVTVTIDGSVMVVKGPQGELKRSLPSAMILKQEGTELLVERPSDESAHKALHGLTRTLVANMVEGVTNGFERKLEIVGVGYRAEKKGSGIILHLGYSHTINYPAQEGIEIDVPVQTEVVVKGADKQKVGQVAAEIRGFRPPEPYKGKGVRYAGEHIRRKAGKTAGS
jgi:large subunit ribosomal protein L6